MSRQILITVLMLIASGSYVRSQIRTRVDLVVVSVSVKDAKGEAGNRSHQRRFHRSRRRESSNHHQLRYRSPATFGGDCRRRWHEREPASMPLSKGVTFSF